MSIKFVCEKCGHSMEVNDQLEGQHGVCKHCGHPLTVPHHTNGEPEGGLRLRPTESDEPERVDARLLAPQAPLAMRTHEADPHVKPKAISDPDQAPAPSDLWDDAGRAKQQGMYEVSDTGSAGHSHASGAPLPAWRLFPRQVARFVAANLRTIRNWLYVVSVVALAMAVFGYLFKMWGMMHTGATLVILTNIGMLVVGAFYLITLPFEESTVQGVLNLFPPYAIYFWITRWQKMKKPVTRTLASFTPIALVAVLYLGYQAYEHPDEIKAELKAGEQRIEQRIEGIEEKIKGQPAPAPADAPKDDLP